MNAIQGANPLRRLEGLGQSPWLDFIQRGFVADGSLQRLIEADGLKGVTSNPSIFEKAMGGGTDYDDGFRALAAECDRGAVDIYEHLAIEDIRAACDAMLPVYEATRRDRSCRSSPSSATTWSGSSETRYEYRDTRASTPGNSRALATAPPSSSNMTAAG